MAFILILPEISKISEIAVLQAPEAQTKITEQYDVISHHLFFMTIYSNRLYILCHDFIENAL